MSHMKLKGALGALALVAGFSLTTQAEGPSVSGFVDTAYNYNTNGQRTNTLRGFDANANTLTLQNAQIELNGKSSKDVEYKVSLMYGYDASLTHSAGFVTNPVTTDSFGIISQQNTNMQTDIQQAFIAVPCPLTGGVFTVGKFATPFGAEVIEAKNNFNASRGFLFNYAIPFTHTGVKYSKSLAGVNLMAGVVNGWDNLQDNNKGKTLLTQASKGFGDKLTVTLGGAHGAEKSDTVIDTEITSPTYNQNIAGNINQHQRSLVDVLLSYNPLKNLSLVANYDWGTEEASWNDASGKVRTAVWRGLALHSKYSFTDTLSSALRYENFHDRDGARTLTPQVLHSVTATLECKKNDVITRLEVRQDKSNFMDDSTTPNTRAFQDGDGNSVKDTQTTVGLQWIYAF